METAVTITAVVLGYGIPIFLGVQSWRNGHREWFWSIILATFGILGIFGIWLSSIKIVEGDIAVVIGIVSGLVCLFGFYILAWIKTRKPMSPQIECPTCGKPSKAKRRIFTDKVTGKRILSRVLGTVALVFGVACVALVFMGAGLLPLIAGIPSIVGGLNAFIRQSNQEIEYKCTGCNKKFIQ